MSNPKPDAQSSLAALAALQGNTPVAQPPAAREEPADPPSSDGALSASGFVGMLAKPQPVETEPVETEPLDPAPRSSAILSMARPQPKALGGPEAAARGVNIGNTASIGQAREIQFHDASSQSPAAPKYRKRHVPGWYRAAVPIMFTVGSLLMVPGFWAIGACVALAATLKGYPLMDLIEDENGVLAFTPLCKWAALGMLICLPVAVAMYIMGAVMRKQAMAADEQKTTPI